MHLEQFRVRPIDENSQPTNEFALDDFTSRKILGLKVFEAEKPLDQ
jgi:hypothetical protein